VEALAHGTPVIAYRGGGYLESVSEGETGVFFDTPTEESFSRAIKKFLSIKKDWSRECVAQAKKFSKARFQRELKKFVEEKYEHHS